jgi:uncharacterized repeat protein (TIGR03803 family)
MRPMEHTARLRKPACLWCACAVLAVYAGAAQAQTIATLYSFDGTDGEVPYAALVQGTNGDLYGTTYGGGPMANCDGTGCGTVFRITPGGKLTTLHYFCSQGAYPDCPDGAYGMGLVVAANGDIYGTTWLGGENRGGTIFRVAPGGELTTVYSFCAQSGCADGKYAQGLVQASNGYLYGTTYGGGSSTAFSDGAGTVFRITLGGKLTTLYSFCLQDACPDGNAPNPQLAQSTNGDLYGTTSGSGANSAGTFFKITPSGKLTTLYSFCSQTACTDGIGPLAGPIQANDGNFYGTTSGGGANSSGTVFKITPSGKLTTLYSFCSESECVDGDQPLAGLVQATDGNLYGTTRYGGFEDCCGTAFRITLGGTLTSYSICPGEGCTYPGDQPGAGLVQDTNGVLYGTTQSGGDECLGSADPGCGTVFTLSMGLGPFVKTLPITGAAGAAVKILGTDLTGATSVTFNGTAAAFTVVSSSEITTTVPAGATSGTVEVVTPSGTLLSNVAFQVSQ